MQRYDIINKLIKKNGYKSYLEIGTQGFQCINRVECDVKDGVDPRPVGDPAKSTISRFYNMYSDNFFKRQDLYREYDIIFVDGLHHCQQVIMDIINSLTWVAEKGTIVVHDCNPLTEISQRVPKIHTSTWNGDVWRAWLKFRARKDLSMYVVNCDNGCGVIQWGKQKTIDIDYMNVSFDDLNKNRKLWLNLITENQFNENL